VYCLAVLPGGEVIVGGRFETAGGVPATSIARYNTSNGAWSALEPVVNAGVSYPVIRSLAAMPDGDVIVGGDFVFGGAVQAWRVARYAPRTGTWSAVGSPIEYGFVRALAVLTDGSVLAGGAFGFATGPGVAFNIARYAPSSNSWFPLGSGVPGQEGVFALAVMHDGDAIVGGQFGVAGGTSAHYIARHFFGLGIDSQPLPRALCLDRTASYSVTASGNGPFAFQWRWRRAAAGAFADVLEGVNTDPGTGEPLFIATDARSSEVRLAVLDGALEAPARCEFQVVITNSCGTMTSSAAPLTVCIGDYNCDGGVDGDDVIAFFSAWDASDAAGDINLDGGVDGDDVIAFFGAWDTGC
jgi:hypothetical protein